MWAGRTVDVEDFLWSLSSSSQLRCLEIISIFHHPNQANTTPRSYGFPILLPALELLYLEDLYKDLLDHILGSITPGSHHTTLHLTRKCIRMYPPHDNEVFGFHDSKLCDFKIDTLMIGNDLGLESTLRPLLEMVPTVTSLYLDCLILTPSRLRSIINSAGPNNKAVAHGFPRLHKLYIGQSYSRNIAGFHTLKEVVASHPIKELGLGVVLSDIVDGAILLHHLRDPHEKLNPFREWFLKAVPKVVWLPAPVDISMPLLVPNPAWRRFELKVQLSLERAANYRLNLAAYIASSCAAVCNIMLETVSLHGLWFNVIYLYDDSAHSFARFIDTLLETITDDQSLIRRLSLSYSKCNKPRAAGAHMKIVTPTYEATPLPPMLDTLDRHDRY
ncbi:hypothetical protein RSAG8_11785, partial [Rhizoctonia solani AG-8 WAC10335]